MTDLDDVDAITALDSRAVLNDAETLSQQIERGWELGLGAHGLPDPSGIDAVVVLGMGGSGFSGDALQAVLEPRLPVFVRVIRDYSPLPEWVGRNTLVLAVSYSGNTEETLDALAEARERGARTVTVASGGKLDEAAQRFGMAHVTIPPGFLPRFAAGYLLMSLLGIVAALGFTPDLTVDVSEAAEVLAEAEARCHRRVPVAQNPAKSLAASLADHIPVVYGAEGPGLVAARRLKTDVNENAKLPALAGAVPEADHNDLEAWGHWSTGSRWPFLGVFLRDEGEHPRVSERFELMREVLAGRLEIVTVRATGQTRLARLLSHVGIGQLASVYLALRSGRDPGPIEVLETFKQRLSRIQS